MIDSELPAPHPHAGRRRIATRALADATGIGVGIVRRPASARRTTASSDDSKSTI
jgi:hypothetical protein